ncbi:transposase [Maledivibacter halophilus]|uniref:Transposase domain n=1 Tax=Maledivibacter halophilus TaxID=36842 RepID=A0A1T5KC98_9FIRM|nr:transposase [Maledivibacter halophilus]SKC61296.1 Transposase domain [Maledivibacter halophilus]SKC90015.1 Transposase domain [Maledivibacter halophilus]SKC92971.1 Transposase domain [Maledivibacter halophilus]
MFSLSEFKQLNLFEQFSSLKVLSYEKPEVFLNLIKDNFNLESFIPDAFRNHYYSSLGRNRDYNLSSILAALLFMHMFNIPTTTLLTLFLQFSKVLREFCGFNNKVPDDSFFSRFKINYEKDICDLFNSMTSYVLDICNEFDESLDDDSPLKGLASILIYDTSGLKPKVKENNPKTLASEINKQKTYAKITNNEIFNPYAAAYKNMPKQAETNSSIKLDFVNGHFGYFYKFGILTNGFGIPMHINFFDDDFYSSIDDVFDTPEEQKFSFDNASLKPVIDQFFKHNPNKKFISFLGDSEFDSYNNFSLLKHYGFEKVFIPINTRNTNRVDNSDLEFDVSGAPLCLLTKEPFIPEGICRGKNRSPRLKYKCPKARRDKKGKCYHTCENPCTSSKAGRMHYVYPDKDFRLYPGIQRNSDEWNSTYKLRTTIERTIASLKKNSSIAFPITLNTTSMRANLFLTAITKLINVIVANAINKPQYFRSIRKLYKLAS